MNKVLQTILSVVDRKVEENGAQYTAFGLFVACTYPTWYFFWVYFSKQPYSNLSLRIIATVLCLILALNKYWPDKAKRYLPIYWYVTLTYCLPFFFTYMTIKNLYSPIWVANGILSLYFLILLVDFSSFIVLFLLGTFIGILLAYIPYPPELGKVKVDYFGIIITYLVSLVIGGMFAHNREKMEQAKLQTMKALGATVAHELRTPLATIQFSVSGTKDYFPALVQGYTIAKDHQLKVPFIQPNHLKILSNVFDSIESEIKYADTIINMILMNVKHNTLATSDFKVYSMRDCIEEALSRYPFKQGEEDLIEWSGKEDFLFYGDKTLMIHVLFNLMKNSFYYMEVSKKGKIKIWCNSGDKNKLFFKDTALGISPKTLPKLFEKFYTTTRHGTGLGLAYCKMVMSSFGGSISCTSKFGEFTQFEMNFPKLGDDDKNR